MTGQRVSAWAAEPAEARTAYRNRLFVVSCVVLGLASPVLRGDTVFLKNGALIDGVVKHRDDSGVVLQIGQIGQLDIATEDIFLIEKNRRVGGELLKSRLDSRTRVDLLEKEKDKLPASDSKDSKDGARGKGREGDGDDESRDPDADDALEDGENDGIVEDAPVLGEEEESIDPELKKRIGKLVKDLDRQKRRYRVRAERHLKAIGRPAVPFLVPLASSERDLTRVAVMRLFYSFGDDRVIEPSIEALVDVNEYVREYANRTLVRITGENFGFHHRATPRRRELSQRKWKGWWKAELAELEESRKAAGSSR